MRSGSRIPPTSVNCKRKAIIRSCFREDLQELSRRYSPNRNQLDCGNSTDVLEVVIPPFSTSDSVVISSASKRHRRRKNHRTHSTLQMPVTASDPSNGETEDASLKAEITVLPTPAGTCGQWSLNAEESRVDLSALKANPVVVSIGQRDDSGCSDQIQAQFDNDDNQSDDNNQ